MKPPNFTLVQILSLAARARKTPHPAPLYPGTPGPLSVEKAWLPGKVIYFPHKLNVFSLFAIWYLMAASMRYLLNSVGVRRGILLNQNL